MQFSALKKLTILSLVILLLPFFQTCSDKNIMENQYLKDSPLLEAVSPAVDSISGGEVEIFETKEFNYTSKELAEKKRETVNKFLALKDNMTNNGYQLGFMFIEQIDRNDFFNSIDLGFLPFFLTQVIAVLLIYFSFRGKVKEILILSILNILFLVTHLMMSYFSGFLEDINQIKFGYYLFVINLFLIASEAYKERKKLTNSI